MQASVDITGLNLESMMVFLEGEKSTDNMPCCNNQSFESKTTAIMYPSNRENLKRDYKSYDAKHTFLTPTV